MTKSKSVGDRPDSVTMWAESGGRWRIERHEEIANEAGGEPRLPAMVYLITDTHNRPHVVWSWYADTLEDFIALADVVGRAATRLVDIAQ